MIRQKGLFEKGPGGKSFSPNGFGADLLLMEDAARRAGLELKYCDLRDGELTIKSGLCVLRAKALLLVDKRLTPREKASAIARELASMDLEALYLPPAARDLIESLGR